MKLSRRFFIGSALASSASLAADKLTDGGFAEVSEPGVPARINRDGSPAPLVPPGAGSYKNFRSKCVGCLLCVAACPNKVLRPSKGRFAPTPEMGYEKGWCRPECVKCGSVCPAGAIRKITKEEKKDIYIGHAIWHKDACLAAQMGIHCTLCVRHCPVHAITQVKLRPDDPKSPLVPVINKTKCIGCGACEHTCPARPMPGITVKGFERHREVLPADGEDAVREAMRLINEQEICCVLVKDGVIVQTENGRGIMPLLRMLDGHAETMRGATVVDKVVGRAAAAIAVKGGVVRVVGALMSEDAKAFLSAHGVKTEAVTLTPKILNRKKDGICPMEDAVKDCEDPSEMINRIRAKVAELKNS